MAPTMTPPRSVLFACGLNSSARRWRRASSAIWSVERAYVASAGVQTGELDPFAVAAMAEIGSTSASTGRSLSRNWRIWKGLDFDLIVTLSPKAHHKALELTASACREVEYWPTADPSVIEGSREQRMHGYREVREQLAKRILDRFGSAHSHNE